jgi:hypothetical protein
VGDFEPPFTRASKEHRTNTESNMLSNCLKFLSLSRICLVHQHTPTNFYRSHANSRYSCPRLYVMQGKTCSFSYVRSKMHLCVRSAISSLFARSLPVCDCCIVIDMVSLAAEYGAKLKECEEILASMPVSAVKSKADAVQHLLNDNTNLISGAFERPVRTALF